MTTDGGSLSLLNSSQDDFSYKCFFLERKTLILAATSLIAKSIVALLVPLPFKWLFDFIIVPKDPASTYSALYTSSEKLIILFIIFLTLTLLEVLLIHYSHKASIKYATKTSERIQNIFFNKVKAVKYSAFDSLNYHGILYLFTKDIKNIEIASIQSLSLIFVSIPMIIIILGIIMVSSPTLFLSCILIVLINLYLMVFLSKKMRVKNKTERTSWNKWVRHLTDRIKNFYIVKSFGVEDKEFEASHSLLEHHNQHRLDAETTQTKYQNTALISQSLLRSMLLLFGGYSVLKGSLSVGDFVLWYTYLKMLRPQMIAVAKVLSRVEKTKVSWDQLIKIQNLFNVSLEAPGDTDLIDLEEDNTLKINNLILQNPGNSKPLTTHPINLVLNSGDILIVKGRSGVGKSVFVNTLMMMSTNEMAGELIFWNKFKFKEMSKKNLRQSIAYCPQFPNWMNISLRENLNLASIKSSPDSLLNTKMTEFDLFTDQQNAIKLDDIIGSGGRRFSGENHNGSALSEL